MNHNFTCGYGRVLLRPLTAEGSERLRQIRNKPEIRKWFISTAQISKEAQQKWYEKYLQDPTDFMYAVYLKSDPQTLIGSYADYHYDEAAGTVEAGRLMVDTGSIQERGIGTDVVICGQKLIFENLGIKKVLGEVYTDNVRALHSDIDCAGFEIVGTREDNGREITLLELTRERFYQFMKQKQDPEF